MNNFFIRLNDYINTIMIIFGIINSYPDVELFNININKDLNNYYVQFETKNLINNTLYYIINEGIEINILFKISTYSDSLFEKTIFYSNNIIYSIIKKDDIFIINHTEVIKSDILTNYFDKINIKILDSYNNYTGKKLKTQIELFLKSPVSSELSELWGNKPKLIISYIVR